MKTISRLIIIAALALLVGCSSGHNHAISVRKDKFLIAKQMRKDKREVVDPNVIRHKSASFDDAAARLSALVRKRCPCATYLIMVGNEKLRCESP